MTDVWASAGRPRGRRLALDLTLTTIFAVIGIVSAFGLGPASVVVAVLLSLALLLRHFRLWTAVAIATAAGLIQLFVPHSFSPVADLGYAALCFRLGTARSTRTRQVGLALVVLAVISTALLATFNPAAVSGINERGPSLMSGLVTGVFAAVVTVGGWVAGLLQLRSRQAVQLQVDAQIEEAERRRLAFAYEQEQERSRIAADMHDVVAHAWAVVAAQADGARYLLRSDPDRAEAALEVIGDTARSTIGDLRTILQQLRYEESAGVLPGSEQTDTLFARMRASGMHLQDVEYGEPSTHALLALTAYRILGESLTNALKHGDLDRPVTVTQDWRDGYRLTVRNRTRVGARTLGTGNGITGMTERATVAGGRLVAHAVGHDWVVETEIPTPQEDSP